MLTLILAALTLYIGDENAALAGKGKTDAGVAGGGLNNERILIYKAFCHSRFQHV